MVNNLRKQFAAMSYRDMVDFSTMLSEALPDSALPEDIAKVLIDLPKDTDDNQIENTNDILQSMFKRKRQITVQQMKPGVFKFCCPSFGGAVVFDSNIREGMSQLLDTITVLEVFGE